MLLRITAPHFTAGLFFEMKDQSIWLVRSPAPILRYMIGWGLFQVMEYCKKKGWTYEVIDG